jgi:hypothetical protein
MMHLWMRGAPERLAQAALEVSEQTGVWLFERTMQTGAPSWQRIEITVGDGAMEIEIEEIGRLIEDMLERARRGGG